MLVPVDVASASGAMDTVDGADAGGVRTRTVLRGDAALVRQRRHGCTVRRSKQAVMAALDAECPARFITNF